MRTGHVLWMRNPGRGLVDEDPRTMRTVVHEPRVVAGIALMLVATLLGGLLLQGASQRVSVWLLSHDVAAGTVLTTADVRLGTAAPGAEAQYLDARDDVAGRVLARDASAGEMLPRAALADGTPRLHLVAVPVDRGRLVPGVRRGVRVDIWWTADVDGGGAGPTRRIVRDALVAGISESSAGGSAVVVALAPAVVHDVISAARTGAIDISVDGKTT